MKEQMERIECKVDKMIDELSQTRVDIAQIKVDVAHHIKRSDAFELALKPVTAHVQNMQGAFMLMGGISLIAGIAAAIAKILGVY